MAFFTWEDRLVSARLVTPDLVEYDFLQYTDLELQFEKKTSSYNFGETDKQLIQDFGLGAVNIPLTIYISGPNYDIEAKNFQDSVLLKGLSFIEHPVYGTADIVITRVTRRDNFVSGAGQAIFTLEISETIIPQRPDTGLETRGLILTDMSALAELNNAALAANFLTDLINDALAAKNRLVGFVNKIKNEFNQGLATIKRIQNAFESTAKFITDNIDFLLGSPLQLAAAFQNLISTPARLATSIQQRVDQYKKIYEGLLDDALGNGQDKKNQLAEKQLLTTAAMSGMAEAYLFPENEADEGQETEEYQGFLTQADAINAAADLIDQYATVQEFLDQQQENDESNDLDLRFTVSDEVTAQIKKIISATAKNLVRLSFSLKKEIIIEVQADTNILSMCHELYGTTKNETLDYFIRTNNLTGDELLTIPRGKKIKSYA